MDSWANSRLKGEERVEKEEREGERERADFLWFPHKISPISISWRG